MPAIGQESGTTKTESCIAMPKLAQARSWYDEREYTLILLHHFPDTADDNCTAEVHIIWTFDRGIHMVDAGRPQTGEIPFPSLAFVLEQPTFMEVAYPTMDDGRSQTGEVRSPRRPSFSSLTSWTASARRQTPITPRLGSGAAGASVRGTPGSSDRRWRIRPASGCEAATSCGSAG